MATSDAIQDFEQAVLTHMSRHHSTRIDAVSAVRRSNPELAHEYLMATNPGIRARREIQERYDSLNRELAK